MGFLQAVIEHSYTQQPPPITSAAPQPGPSAQPLQIDGQPMLRPNYYAQSQGDDDGAFGGGSGSAQDPGGKTAVPGGEKGKGSIGKEWEEKQGMLGEDEGSQRARKREREDEQPEND